MALDGESLTRAQVAAVAAGEARVWVSPVAAARVRRARVCVEEAVARGAVVYGVNTGFGSNADVLLSDLGAAERLQRNLIVTHAVCVGEPLPPPLVRAMMLIRINTLLRGYSGVRLEVIARLVEMLNEGLTPVIPSKGSVGASGDLAPLSHMALPLLGEGEVWWRGARAPSREALRALPSLAALPAEEREARVTFELSYKEGLALNNGTAQMTASLALAVDRLERLARLADLNAALAVEAVCGRSAAFREDVHALRPHEGQRRAAHNIRALLQGSTLVDAPFEAIPQRLGTWALEPLAAHGGLAFEGDAVVGVRLRGGKPARPQDSYSLRCAPQVHGAVRDALLQAERVLMVELNAVTDNPLVFPDLPPEEQFASAGHFHGMPVALALSYVKAALVPLASIAERRLNKLVDPATSDGLPAFLARNLDGSESGFMIVQYTAAALVNDLATRAHPATVFSVPTSANSEDHVSMGANEARHVLDMLDDVACVLGLELMTAAQALDVRLRVARGEYWPALRGERAEVVAHRVRMQALALHASPASMALLDEVRRVVPYLDADRGLSGDVEAITREVMARPERFIGRAEEVVGGLL
ncbi:MAG: aromatic amino acid lyase [Deltaproteobacteria bacterium]|nr:aromatic amino acid lyase [Deltaproteobacteria bacterium]